MPLFDDDELEEHYEIRDASYLSKGLRQIIHVYPDGTAKAVGSGISDRQLGLLREALNQDAKPEAVQQLLTTLRFQDSRDFPDGGSTLVTSRGHGETHTEFALADLLELRRQTDARIAVLTAAAKERTDA